MKKKNDPKNYAAWQLKKKGTDLEKHHKPSRITRLRKQIMEQKKREERHKLYEKSAQQAMLEKARQKAEEAITIENIDDSLKEIASGQ